MTLPLTLPPKSPDRLMTKRVSLVSGEKPSPAGRARVVRTAQATVRNSMQGGGGKNSFNSGRKGETP